MGRKLYHVGRFGTDREKRHMGFWDKAKEAAKVAAEKAGEAKNKAVNVARDQYYREDSAFNQAARSAGKVKDKALAAVDSLDTMPDESIAAAKRTQSAVQAESKAGTPDAVLDEQNAEPDVPLFPNSMDWSDEEVYRQVVETMFPEFAGLRGKARVGLCEIARLEKRLVSLNRSIGSAYIETFRQLAAGDDTYQLALEACGVWQDEEIRRAYRYWLEDLYDDAFYADDDGGHSKGERLLGWLVASTGGQALVTAMTDAGLEDPYGLASLVARQVPLIAQHAEVAVKHFRPRRSKFDTQFLVQRGINADLSFVWLDEDDETPGDDGGSSLLGGAGLTEL